MPESVISGTKSIDERDVQVESSKILYKNSKIDATTTGIRDCSICHDSRVNKGYFLTGSATNAYCCANCYNHLPTLQEALLNWDRDTIRIISGYVFSLR